MRNVSIQRELYKCHAEMCQVFSHPTRLAILNTLREQELAVSDLARRLQVSIGNLSQHLSMMKQRRVLAARKEGNKVYYRLGNLKMLRAFDLIREILLEQMQQEAVLVRHMERTQAGSRRREIPFPQAGGDKHGEPDPRPSGRALRK